MRWSHVAHVKKKKIAVLACDRAKILPIAVQVPLNPTPDDFEGFTKKKQTSVPSGAPGYNSINHMKDHMTRRYAALVKTRGGGDGIVSQSSFPH